MVFADLLELQLLAVLMMAMVLADLVELQLLAVLPMPMAMVLADLVGSLGDRARLGVETE